MVGRYSTAKVDFWLLTPNFPLFMNKQSLLHFPLPQLPSLSRKPLTKSWGNKGAEC